MCWTKGLFCFHFLCLCRAYSSVISLRFSQSSSLWEVNGQSSPTFQLPFLLVKRQSTVQLLSRPGKMEQAQELGKKRRWWGASHRPSAILHFETVSNTAATAAAPWVRCPHGQGGSKEEFGQLESDAPTAERLPTRPHFSLLTHDNTNFGVLCKARRDQHHGLCLLQLVPLHTWNICWISLPLEGQKSHR